MLESGALHPLTALDLVDGKSLHRVFLHHADQKVLNFRREVLCLGLAEIPVLLWVLLDQLVRPVFLAGVTYEWRRPGKHDEKDYSHRENVGLLSVIFASFVHDFWCLIPFGTFVGLHETGAISAGQKTNKAKVCDFEHTFLV